jgi:hypothetical protein
MRGNSMNKFTLTPEALYQLMREHDMELGNQSEISQRLLESEKEHSLYSNFLELFSVKGNVDEMNYALIETLFAYNESGFVAGFKACANLLLNV